MFAVLLLIAVGAFIYAIGVFLIVAIVWLFTTWVGLFLLALFVLAVIGNFLTPPPDDDGD